MNSPVVQYLGLSAVTAEDLSSILVKELRSHKPCGMPPPSPNSPKKKKGGNGVNKVDFLITKVFFKHFMKLRVKITDPLKEFVSCNYRHKIIK